MRLFSRRGPLARFRDRKMVFAHYMLGLPANSPGNTVTSDFQSVVDQMKVEIGWAKEQGYDGFALNTGAAFMATIAPDNRMRDNANKLYEAALQRADGFKLFYSADANSANLTVATCVEMVTGTTQANVRYGEHPNQLRVDGKPFLSTFAGTNITDHKLFWTDVKNQTAAAGLPIYLLPGFFTPTGTYAGTGGLYPDSTYLTNLYTDYGTIIEGLFYWMGSAAGINGAASARAAQTTYKSTSNTQGKKFMATAHPNFYSKKTTANNKVFGNMAGAGGMKSLWEGIVADDPRYVEVVTWNDWPESTYYAPVDSTTGTAGLTTNMAVGNYKADAPHNGYAELQKYYIDWWKTQVQPTITQDLLVVAYRTHSRDLVLGDSTTTPAYMDDVARPKPDSYDTLEDKVYVSGLLKSAATIRITTNTTTEDFALPAGPFHVSRLFVSGAVQSATRIRAGDADLVATGPRAISDATTKYSYNHVTGWARG